MQTAVSIPAMLTVGIETSQRCNPERIDARKIDHYRVAHRIRQRDITEAGGTAGIRHQEIPPEQLGLIRLGPVASDLVKTHIFSGLT